VFWRRWAGNFLEWIWDHPKGSKGVKGWCFGVFFPRIKGIQEKDLSPRKPKLAPKKVLVLRRYLQPNQNHKEDNRKNNINNIIITTESTDKRERRIQRTSNSNGNSNIEIAMTTLMTNDDNHVFVPMHIAGSAKHNNKMTFTMLRKLHQTLSARCSELPTSIKQEGK